MAKNKRSDLTVNEVVDLVSKKWRKAQSGSEVAQRAKRGFAKVGANHCSLNDIWNLYKEYPEVFLYSGYVAEIQKEYIDFHTNDYGKFQTQENNMQLALDKIIAASKLIYGDLALVAKDEKTRKNLKIAKKQEEEAEKFLGASGLDDDTDSMSIEKIDKTKAKGKYKRLEKGLKKLLLEDNTPIVQFLPKDGGELIAYFKFKSISTLGDYMTFMSTTKNSNNFAVYGMKHRQGYEDFNKAVLNYANEQLEIIVSTDKTKDGVVNPKDNSPIMLETKKINSIEDVLSFDASNFVKGSKSMNEISNQVGEYLKQYTDKCLTENMSIDFIEEEINAKLKKFHDIVDQKRYENLKRLAGARIKAKIDEGVKYKHDSFKPSSEHMKNPFVEREF